MTPILIRMDIQPHTKDNISKNGFSNAGAVFFFSDKKSKNSTVRITTPPKIMIEFYYKSYFVPDSTKKI